MMAGFVWKCLGIILISVAIHTHSAEGKKRKTKGCNTLFVGLTVSSLADTDPPRKLELVWANAKPQAGDFVALYKNATLKRPLFKANVSWANGHKASSVAAPVTNTAALSFNRTCLGFYVAYVRNNTEVLASSCLGTRPHWMAGMRSVLSNLTLRTVFLPGVHDAAAYHKYNGSEGNIIGKHTFTQEEDVLTLLVHGARYLDMRVAYRSNQRDVWWTNHALIVLRPLQDIIDQVKRFMDNTDEIVIFDIHELTGFWNSTAINEALAKHLVAELGSYAVPSALTWNATLSDVWASGRRLVVTFPDARIVAKHDELWPIVMHQWGNVQTVEELRDYGVKVFSADPPLVAWSFMAELTASNIDIALNGLGGLRDMADAVNQNVTTWFSRHWGTKANIVATDFFRGNLIVHEAIVWNLVKSTGSPCPRRKTSPKKKSSKKEKANKKKARVE